MIERLDFTELMKYNSIEAAIHFNRYLTAKPFIKGKRVLDVACGEGYGSKLLKDWGAEEVVGIDISEEAIKVAIERFSETGIKYIQHAAEELPFENDNFDIVISFETIEHVDNPEQFLMEISRVLRFNGTALISCPNDPYYYKQGEVKNPFHKRVFTWFEFAELTQKYLGDNVNWYFGFAANGFMNIPQRQCTEPETKEISSQGMSGMFEAESLSNVALIPQDRYINHWNCNYYLGIFGSSLEVQNASIFPREFFVEPEDPVIADVKSWDNRLEMQKKEYENHLSKLHEEKEGISLSLELAEKKWNDTKEEISTLKKEKEDIVLSLELAEKKRNDMKEEIYTLKKEKEEVALLLELAEKKQKDTKEEKRILTMERERVSILLNLAQKENAHLWQRICANEEIQHNMYEQIERGSNELNSAEMDLEIIKRTKGYRMLRKCWDIIDLLKKNG